MRVYCYLDKDDLRKFRIALARRNASAHLQNTTVEEYSNNQINYWSRLEEIVNMVAVKYGANPGDLYVSPVTGCVFDYSEDIGSPVAASSQYLTGAQISQIANLDAFKKDSVDNVEDNDEEIEEDNPSLVGGTESARYSVVGITEGFKE